MTSKPAYSKPIGRPPAPANRSTAGVDWIERVVTLFAAWANNHQCLLNGSSQPALAVPPNVAAHALYVTRSGRFINERRTWLAMPLTGHICRMRQGVSTNFHLHHGDALRAYPSWPAPATIISDGAYGVRGFDGDPTDVRQLSDWYRPHIAAWSAAATPATTLWFWGTEIGWATVHPELDRAGWEYVQTITWDKGVGHIAGNVNGQTIRRFPVVTEVCALYQHQFELESEDGELLGVQAWLRQEWRRSGLPMRLANDACGVRTAAVRKYLGGDWQWYFPPGRAVEQMADFCTQHGKPTARPYFSLDGVTPVTAVAWDRCRYVWNHAHGLTNVWSRPALRDSERITGSMVRSAPRAQSPTSTSASHLNQKPIEFMERIISATTRPGDVVWEPFGGLASTSVAALRLGRVPYAAEINPMFAGMAQERLEREALRLTA